MLSFAEWTGQGQRIPIRLGANQFRIWSRRRGSGRSLTLLHGFPTSAHDWSGVIAKLSDLDTLTFDFLGFGDSDKPSDHDYSIHEQADLVEAMWAHHGIRASYLAVHDYAVSVAEELLARRTEGRLSVDLLGVVFLNGGIYPDLHRALPAQEALLDPERGPLIGQMVTEETFTASLLLTFPPDRPPPAAVMHELWCAVANRDGQRIGYRLIKYILDRRRHAERWTTALEHTDVPRRFVWGMLDPVSGGHVVPRIRERLPTCPLVCLADVAHWPAIEDPDTVTAAIRALIAL
jgi:pimeloyl-ACP methyl ester carboxylesterase